MLHPALSQMLGTALFHERLREAEHRRLTRRAPAPPSIRTRLLRCGGGRLVAWGRRLQANQPVAG